MSTTKRGSHVLVGVYQHRPGALFNRGGAMVEFWFDDYFDTSYREIQELCNEFAKLWFHSHSKSPARFLTKINPADDFKQRWEKTVSGKTSIRHSLKVVPEEDEFVKLWFKASTK